jgi:hypothetical protein
MLKSASALEPYDTEQSDEETLKRRGKLLYARALKISSKNIICGQYFS